MKKVLFGLPIVVTVVMMSVLCSCGNKANVNQAEAVIDSVAVEESTEAEESVAKEFDRESVEKDLKAFLADYVNTMNENIFSYLSDDFKGVIKKWESIPNVGEWNLFGLNSAAEIRKYSIESLSEPVDNRVRAHVKLGIENEEDYYDDKTNIYLILVDDKWLVDEIDEVKQNMKKNLSENRAGSLDTKDFDGYDSRLSEKRLTETDLKGKSKKELEIMRNSIYARYGYKFKRKDLLDYFSQYSWYNPTTSDMATLYKSMTDIERYNIELIKKQE